MKRTYLYMMCFAAITFAACTNELEESTMPADNALVLTVGDYPAFSEGPDTRVGTFDRGKTAWEEGDQILVSVTSSSSNQYATLTYANSTWTPSQPLTRPSDDTYTINAWYAPAYEWNSGTLSLLSGKQAGTDEFLATTSSDGTITFTTNDRRYSRLRIAGSPRTNLNVSLTDFTPAGNNTSSGTTNIDLTTDDKGNAYLYGTWAGSSNLDVTYGSTSLVDKNITTASVENTSYVVDASFATNFPNASTYDQIGSGTENCPYILLNGIQFKDFASNGDKAKHYKMDKDIDITDYSNNWNPGDFSGTLDGGDNAIIGFNYSNSANLFGLFNKNGGIIKNLTISFCSITNSSSNNNIGTIACSNYGTIENCHVSGKISGFNVGGIAATNYGNIIACSNSAAITANSGGGICCNCMGNAAFIGCYNTGTINAPDKAGIWRYILISGTISTQSCYTTVENIYGSASSGTANVTSSYYMNGQAITEHSGATVANWQAAIDDMNNTLQSGSYDYRYEMGDNNLPVIRRYTP